MDQYGNYHGKYKQCCMGRHVNQYVEGYTLCLFNIAMENGPFIDGLPGFTY